LVSLGYSLILIIGLENLYITISNTIILNSLFLLIKITTDSDVTLNIITILYGIAKTIKQ
ncbi:hypothetical protein, partial [Lachnospira eligens]|uniref:hypothetical protein n=1 Tax=Lachnospira eligens TaxID=39485 RepID=UPI001A9A605D